MCHGGGWLLCHDSDPRCAHARSPKMKPSISRSCRRISKPIQLCLLTTGRTQQEKASSAELAAEATPLSVVSAAIQIHACVRLSPVIAAQGVAEFDDRFAQFRLRENSQKWPNRNIISRRKFVTSASLSFVGRRYSRRRGRGKKEKKSQVQPTCANRRRVCFAKLPRRHRKKKILDQPWSAQKWGLRSCRRQRRGRHAV